MTAHDWIRDPAEIYRRSFAAIRAEADIGSLPAELQDLGVRVVHACGMTDIVADLEWSVGAAAAGRTALAAGAPILVDAFSADFLRGAVVDFSDALTGGGFKISNPNAAQSCGCGKSFATEPAPPAPA